MHKVLAVRKPGREIADVEEGALLLLLGLVECEGCGVCVGVCLDEFLKFCVALGLIAASFDVDVGEVEGFALFVSNRAVADFVLLFLGECRVFEGGF